MKHTSNTLLAVVRIFLCAVFAFLFSVSAFAHTALKESTPADGATIKEAPAHISLVFNRPVKLIKLKLMGVGHEMATGFESTGEAQALFTIETPGMHPGAFTVNWAVIGEDGHTVTGSYTFTVDADTAEVLTSSI